MNESQATTGTETLTAYEFPSLTVLKQAHLKLLGEEMEPANLEGKNAEFLENVREFMLRARATGRILEDEKERGIAQTLLNYWATVLFRAGVPDETVPQTSLLDLDENAGRDLDESQCPYCGLQAYTEETSHLFFGRKHVIDKWLGILAGPKSILVVLGPSGSGKTSLVKAGLVPALRNDDGAARGWKITEVFLPNTDSADRLLASVQQEQAADNQPELLVLHRLDEGLLSCDRKLQRKLIAAFKDWLGKPGRQRKAILVSRAESAALVAQWLREADLTEKSEQVFVPPFDARELRAVIEAPAERIGLRFDEGLVDTLVNEFLGDPAALTLLQFVLLKLWDARERNRITWAAYHAIGGGQRAVENTAEAIYLAHDFSDEERKLTEKTFLRLVRPTLTSALAVHPVAEAALASETDSPERVRRVVERFTEARLLRVKEDGRGERQVEIVQEALIRKWPRFLLWLEDARQELLERRRIAEAAAQWREGGRHRSALWTGILLERALALRDQLSSDELEFVLASRRAITRRFAAAFVVLSALLLVLSVISARAYYKWRETKAALNNERGERLLERFDPAAAFLLFNQAARDDPSHSMKLRYRAWRRLIFPLRSDGPAAEAQERTNQLRLGAAWWQLPRLKYVVYLPELTRSVLSPDGEYLAGTSNSDLSLWHLLPDGQTQEAKPLSNHLPSRVMWASFSENPKQPLLAVALTRADAAGKSKPRGEVLVFDPKTNQPVGQPILFSDGDPQKVWFDPQDDKRLLIIKQFADGNRASVGIWNRETGAQEAGDLASDLPINWAAFSPDGELIVRVAGILQGGDKGEATVWDWKKNQRIKWQTDAPVAYAEFDAQGHQVVTAEGADEATRGAARVWNIARGESGESVVSVEAATAPLTHRGAVTRARFSPDGLWVASAGRDRTTRLWHVGTQKEVLRFEQSGDVTDVAFSPDGRYLGSAGRDRTARVWEVATGQPVFVFNHSETVAWLGYSRDGRSLVTSAKHVAQIWSADPAEPKRPIVKAQDAVLAAISGDGQRVFTASGWHKDEPSEAQVWDTKSGQLIAGGKLNENEKVRFALFDREGKRVCLLVSEPSGNNRRLRVLQIDRETKQLNELAMFKGEAIRQADILAAQFSEGGSGRVALILQNKNEKNSAVALAEIHAKSLRLLSPAAGAQFTRVQFSPKGTYLLACFTEPPTSIGRARVWRLDHSNAVPFELRHETQITSVAFDRSESSILTGSTDDSAKLWRITPNGISDGTVLGGSATSTHTADVTCVAFSPDGRRALTAAKDQTAILWDTSQPAAAPKRLAVLNHLASVNDAVFSASGELVLTFSGEPKLRAWSAVSGELLGLFQPAGDVLQAGFAPDGNSVFAIVQNLVGRRWSGDADDAEFAREIRPMNWTFKPITVNAAEAEKLGELVAARQVANTELSNTQTRLEKAKTEELEQIWRDHSRRYNRLLPPLQPAGEFHLAAADECEATKEWAAAAWHLTQVLNETPPAPERAKLLLRRAANYAEADNSTESLPRCIADHEEAIRLGQNGAADYAALAEAHLNYGKTLQKPDEAAGQWDAAIEAYQKATALDANDADLAIGLGEALAGRRRFVEAGNEFQRAMQLGDNASAPARLAMVGWLRGDEAGKQQYRDICMGLKDPESTNRLLWPAVVTNAFEQDKEFLDLLVKRAQEAVNQAPANFYRRNSLGAALYRAGRFEEAIRELETARANAAADKTNSLSQRYDHLIRIPISPSPDGRPEDWVFLAMANAKLARTTSQPNRPNLAWDWMRKLRDTPQFAQQIRLTNTGQVASGVPRSYPVDYLNLPLELLYDEALTVVRSNRPPPPGPAPTPAPAR